MRLGSPNAYCAAIHLSDAVNFTGTSGAMTKCAMVVGYMVNFGGNTNLQNDTVGCYADMTVPAYIIRLIA